MEKDLPIWILEPELIEKRDSSARRLFEGGQRTARPSETISIDNTRQQIRAIREYARNNLDLFVAKLKNNLQQKYPQVNVKSARDDAEAVEYITRISDGLNVVSINNSGIVAQELRPKLTATGFTIVNSYLNEFDIKERSILDYWDLPRLSNKDLIGTFEVSIKTTGVEPTNDTKKYLAVLGVNAISAEDSTVLFLEHFSNIHNDLEQAEKIILVVGLDKIVKGRQDAIFQTKCMGIFGMESALLGIGPKSERTLSLEELGLLPSDKTRELHVIILDNGRSNLLQGKYEDLFLCIGCRACNQHCPIQHSFTNIEYIWTPRNYLNQFLSGRSDSIDVCLHCEACRLECPLDIDLPYLMWRAKMDYVNKHSPSFHHRILGKPELLARLGTPLAPLANILMNNGLIRSFMGIITGIDRKATLPRFHSRTFKRWFRQNA